MWEYSWWNACAPWPIFLFGYLDSSLVSLRGHDMERVRYKAMAVAAIYFVDMVVILVFGLILGRL
jgi:hypothetical protein